MGRNIFDFPSLLPPLKRAGERYVTIPANHTLIVPFEALTWKIVFYLEDGVEVVLPDLSVIPLHAGDAISLSVPWTMSYRPATPGHEARNHVLGIHLMPPVPTPLVRYRKKSPEQTLSPLAQFHQDIVGKLTGFHYFPGVLNTGTNKEIYQQFRHEAEKGRAASPWKISGLCLALVAGLLEQNHTRSSGPGKPPSKGAAIVEHARHYILEHAGENLSLSHIAWQIRVSGEHLERLFKQHLGITVFDFLGRVRIEKAKQLLLTTDLPVVRIASLCGFSSSNLLGRHFKASTGTTALNYRLQAREHESFSPSTLNPPPRKSQ